MPKKNRIAIYELLFKEGVMVAKKDVHMPKHPELVDKNVPNLHVMKAMQVGGVGGRRCGAGGAHESVGPWGGAAAVSCACELFPIPTSPFPTDPPCL